MKRTPRSGYILLLAALLVGLPSAAVATVDQAWKQ